MRNRIAGMARKRKGDRHLAKPFMIRLHPQVRAQLEKLVDQDPTTNITREIVEAIKHRLREAGLWPPKHDDDKSQPS